MSTQLIGSTILMGLVFAAIFYALSKIGVQRSAEVADTDAVQPYATGPGERPSRQEVSPQRLGALFMLVTLALAAISIGIVGGLGTAERLAPSLLGAAFGLLGLLIVGFIFGGSYAMARSHGLGQAHSVAAGLFVAGSAGILVVAIKLVTGAF